MKIAAEHCLGDMTVRYVLDEEMRVGMELYPTSRKKELARGKAYQIDPLVQWKKAGDAFPYGFANGLTMRNSESAFRMRWKEQRVEEDNLSKVIHTYLEDGEGGKICHTLSYRKQGQAISVQTEFQNLSNKTLTLEMLSSFSIGGITPFSEDEAANRIRVHKLRSKWSTEGRMETRTAEELLLEPTWSRHGVYSDKFGQAGSLPVRGYFPFAAVEDTEEHVVWAAALACPSTWQMELYRRDEALCMSGGIGDFDYGHWCKELHPKESFLTVEACLTVCTGNVDYAAQRLSSLWKKDMGDQELPVIFNEFCTTWGKPSHENISRILKLLRNRPIQYFVIDAGWYADPVKGWESNMGDWEIAKELFPDGMDAAVQEIKANGLIPGIWFEIETCGKDAEAYHMEEHLLKRNGAVITSGGRRFWDMRDPWTVSYLSEKVIDFLEEYEFGYLKVDYNESIGIGCDGAESLGEGLRQNMEATREFFRKIKKRLPHLVIEICASGGHRMEPSMLSLCDMVSFSDAHEEKEIPVIAANIQRLVPAGQSEIWAVFRKTDTIQRIVYSIVNTFLGVMCISGDIFDLRDIQWKWIDQGITFYRLVSHVIKDGMTQYFGTVQKSWRNLIGWQGIVRYSRSGDEVLCVLHRFGLDTREDMEIPLEGDFMIEAVYEEKNHGIQVEGRKLTAQMNLEYEAAAVYLVAKHAHVGER